MVKYNNSTSHRGHNAIVPGASGCGLKEHEVAQKIHDKFRAVTKAVDATDNVGRTANDNLYNIVKKMNAVGKSFHVSHHLNAFNGTANGFEVWYYAGNAQAKKLAEEICAAVCKVTGWVNRGAKATTSLYVIRASTGSAILIEWGFVDSQKDMDIMAHKMDAAVNAALAVFGYSANSSSNNNKSTSKPAASTSFKVGDKVKIIDALYKDSTGAGRSTASRGKTGTIKRVVSGNKPYLIDSLGWAHKNDIQLVTSSTTTATKKVGDTVTVQSHATQYQTGQNIPSWVKGKKYKIKQIKSVNQSKSKKAYLLDGINSWFLEQDVK
ncbi:N-acetylmuramoyl-L-alanine amidase [Enterococcus casseliflavus]|nr:N-acetylmuramoyl-L-alanine amidase [Enterococcus casseliflavus]MBE9898659.1 N-acetylmuramoyl-L-alanine amidase [Enterococcus casseliflavus]MBE9901945.1 N-acetylmuramoyl-L-alanine amidase [Enterococcus casseliflavus]MBE9922352.1 N-acetylmuramoyl-L-alanine amidase [Enterococcus casseliflavus]